MSVYVNYICALFLFSCREEEPVLVFVVLFYFIFYKKKCTGEVLLVSVKN